MPGSVQARVQILDDRCPVGITDDLLLEEIALGRRPEICPVERDITGQRAMRGNKGVDTRRIGGQAELGEQLRQTVLTAVHLHAPFGFVMRR